jgi:hypothetical protein
MAIIKSLITVVFLILTAMLSAQPKEFEGRIMYKTSIQSKVPGVESKIWHNVLTVGDNMTAYIKQGNYKLVSNLSEQYYIPGKQMRFIKFKNLDTLYYMEYSSDTAAVISVSKEGAGKTISGYACTPITIKIFSGETKYFYTPALYLNPEYDKNNTIGQLNVLTRETSSIWLESIADTKSYSITTTCTQLVQEQLNPNVFDLPPLPQKKLVIEELMQPAVFKRAGGWIKYLNSSLDGSVGAKYIKIPKGEKEAIQTVMVRFMVNERGIVMNAEVINKKEVHSKLADEALRVVTSSPPWTPAMIYGEKTIYWQTQPISFQATK